MISVTRIKDAGESQKAHHGELLTAEDTEDTEVNFGVSQEPHSLEKRLSVEIMKVPSAID
jgi:hypothetical protein